MKNKYVIHDSQTRSRMKSCEEQAFCSNKYLTISYVGPRCTTLKNSRLQF